MPSTHPGVAWFGPALDRPDAAAAAVRVFDRIAAGWGLSAQEQATLLGVEADNLEQWFEGRRLLGLDASTRERLTHLFAIYAALHILLPIPERADAWLRCPNAAPLFAGQSALAYMLEGDSSRIAAVHCYLEGQLY